MARLAAVRRFMTPPLLFVQIPILRPGEQIWDVGTPVALAVGSMTSCLPIDALMGLAGQHQTAFAASAGPAVSLSCPVGVCPMSMSTSPPLCPSVERQRERQWAVKWRFHRLLCHVCWVNCLVTRYETLTEPCFSVHHYSISSCGPYQCADFSRCFWSGVGIEARPWEPCPPPVGDFHT